MVRTWLGVDVGGANLKVATGAGWSRSMPFPLWKHPEKLADALAEITRTAPAHTGWAVTMTGELVDCFRTRREGVAAIVAAVERTAIGPVRYWSLAGEWVDKSQARSSPMTVAAANWHGLATWVAREWPARSGLLVDTGSTTTDLIPFGEGTVQAQGRTDLERLKYGELIYLGGRRTPLAMLSPEVTVAGISIRVPAEIFATLLDVGLWLGRVAENPLDTETANGRPATREEAAHRLARQLCADTDEVAPTVLDEVARQWLVAARNAVLAGVSRCAELRPEPRDTVVLGGAGAWLVKDVLRDPPWTKSARGIDLGELLPPGCSEAACAFALSRLAEHLDPALSGGHIAG